jgi:hypothetical protein
MRTLILVLFVLLQVTLVEAKYSPDQIEEFKGLVQARLAKYREGSCLRAVHDYLQTIYGDFQQ